jgi:hypothetical protein
MGPSRSQLLLHSRFLHPPQPRHRPHLHPHLLRLLLFPEVTRKGEQGLSETRSQRWKVLQNLITYAIAQRAADRLQEKTKPSTNRHTL